MISAVAIAGCSTGSTTSSSTTTTSQASTGSSTTVANSVTGTVRWATTNKAVVTAVSADVADLGTALPNAVSSHDSSAATASCQKLATDVATAKALPPIPNSTAQKAWTSLLKDLSSASQKCSEGISNNDTGMLNQAASDIAASSGPLRTVTTTLGL